jgi:dihydrofolate synthase / folylpolyglutamate synthase
MYSLDHMDYLGNDRDAIGFEKAGIYRADKPALFAGVDAPATLERHAAAIGADFMKLDRDFGYTRRDNQWDFWGRRGKHHCLPYPALRGSFQLQNAAGCLAALDELSELLPVTLQDIKQGLLRVDLPGRLQVVPGRPTVILDVAHNPHAASALAENLAAISGPGLTYGVFAMLKDKDIAGVIGAIANRVDRWLLASIAAPRGATAQQVQSELSGLGLGEGELYDSPAAAYSAACRRARQDDRILVFGSFYTVAGVLQQLHQPAAGKDP